MKLVPLFEIVIPTKQCTAKTMPEAAFRYIDIASIDSITKTIEAASWVQPSDAPSRARQPVQPADVLVSTVRPNLNAVAFVPKWLDGAIASTGFCVLRPDAKKINPRYLYYFCRFSGFIDSLTRVATGASYPAVSNTDVLSCLISLPSLANQNKIVFLLERCDWLMRLQRASLHYLRLSASQLFSDFFSSTEAKNLSPMVPFEEMCTIESNTVMPTNSPFNGMLHVGAANIESETGRLLDLKTAQKEGLTSIKFLVTPKNILFSKIRPKLRKVAFPQIDCLCSADIYPLSPKENVCSPEFLLYFLKSDGFSRQVEAIAESRSNIPKVNRDELGAILIPKPPYEIQKKFSSRIRETNRLIALEEESLRNSELLFQSLLTQAFGSEVRSLQAMTADRSVSL